MSEELEVSFVVASSLNGVIGNDNKIPWSCKEDMKRFKSLTLTNVVIMGRKTFESLDKPLVDRINVVVSSSQKEEFIEVMVKSPGKEFTESTKLYKFNDLEKALEYVKRFRHIKKIFVIGGSTLYHQTLHLCKELFLTIIRDEVEGDTEFFAEDLIKHMNSFNRSDIEYKNGNRTDYDFTNESGHTANFIITNQFPSIEQLTTTIDSAIGSNPKCIFLRLQRVG